MFTDWNLQPLILPSLPFFFVFFLLSICLLRLCQSCWRWCVFPSSTRPTCWTWWTMRSWLSRRRRVAIWSTRPSAITCCPTHGKRCRRPGLGRGSLLVHTNSYMWPELNLCASSLAWMTWEQCGSNMICHSPVNLARNTVARPCSGTHIHYLLQQDGGEVRSPQGDLNLPLNCIDFSPQLESNDLELHNVFHTTTVNCEKYTRVIFPNVSTGFSFHKQMTSAEAKSDWGYYEKLKVANHNGFQGFCRLLNSSPFNGKPST